MEYSPSRPFQSNRSSPETTTALPKMSMLAMATASPHPAFSREFPWEASRCSDNSLQMRPDSDRVALPSIRQAFPELHLQLQPQDAVTRPPPSNLVSPAIPALGATSPEYIHSPNSTKRRRLSSEEEQDPYRARQVPRLYRSPERTPAQLSPRLPARSSVSESWTESARTSPFLPNAPRTTAPVPMEVKERAADIRPSLSNLTPPLNLNLNREAASLQHMPALPEGAPRTRSSMPLSGNTAMDSTHRETTYNYSYHHPNRYQSMSATSLHHFERTPFTTSNAYGSPYPDYMRFADLGGIGCDNKQRKRRGNLPKETTDKLRAWFMTHLQHPYPTEDEKQDLMRQTGLQMNQISNWFINARRRQLPTMINNARAESDAMTSARNADAKVLATTERHEFDQRKRELDGHLSDGEGATYEEEFESLSQHRITNMNRGSI